MIFLINLMSSLMKCLKKSINLYTLFIAGLVIISCNYSNRLGYRNQNVWIGSYTDEVFKLPNPKIYTNDSMYKISDKVKAKKINDSINIFKINDSISKTFIKSDSDTINSFYLKARETKFSIDLKDLFKSNWETIEQRENESLKKRKIYSFNNDNKLLIQTNYIFNNEKLYSEIEEYKFRLIKINQTYILHIYNDSHYSYLGQIVLNNKQSFTIEFLNTIKPNIVKFISTKHKVSEYKNLFKVCMEYRILQYYNNSSGTKFNKGLREVKKIVNREFKYTTKQKNQNGYIRIRFIVNCEGKIGRFSIMELNETYLPFSFDPEIVISLFNIINSDLKNDWTPGTFNLNNSTFCDNYKHLTFKIKEGKIIDILP